MTWVFGADPYRNTSNPSNTVANSTGAGTAYNTHGWGKKFSFYIETTDSAWGYQLRTSRTSSGPWAVFSSNSGTSTSVTDFVQIDGPFAWVSPRCKALASTVNNLIVRMTGME
jgi:hypothetical protein